MSYLIRTGNSRNNISWSTTENSTTRYLRRTASGRNNVTWTTIPNGSTYNILQRNGTGKNNVLWANLSIIAAATQAYLTKLFQAGYKWHWSGNENITCYVDTNSKHITWGGPDWSWTTSYRAAYLGPEKSGITSSLVSELRNNPMTVSRIICRYNSLDATNIQVRLTSTMVGSGSESSSPYVLQYMRNSGSWGNMGRANWYGGEDQTLPEIWY